MTPREYWEKATDLLNKIQDSSNNRLVTDERYKELKERMQELLKKQSSPTYNIDENPKDE